MTQTDISREFKQEMEKSSQLDTGTYYWIWGIEEGRRVLCGPEMTEEAAYQWGFKNLTSDFEVVPLSTRDEATASRIMRARLLEETGSPSLTFKRFKHKVS